MMMSATSMCIYFEYPIVSLETNILCCTLPIILSTVDRVKLDVITGNMLGDGHIRSSKKDGIVNEKARYSITIKTDSELYIRFLIDNVYRSFGANKLRPYPNILLPAHANKQVLYYQFETKSSVFLGTLHAM